MKKFLAQDFFELEAESAGEGNYSDNLPNIKKRTKKKFKISSRKVNYSESDDADEYELDDSFIDNSFENYDSNQKIKKKKKQEKEMIRFENKEYLIKKEEEEINNYINKLKNLPLKRSFKDISKSSYDDFISENNVKKKSTKAEKDKLEKLVNKNNKEPNNNFLKKIINKNSQNNSIIKDSLMQSEIFKILESQKTNFFSLKEQKESLKVSKENKRSLILPKPKENYISISKMKKNILREKAKEKNSELQTENMNGYKSDNDTYRNLNLSKSKLSLKRFEIEKEEIKEKLFLKSKSDEEIDEDLEEAIGKYELDIKKRMHQNSTNFKKQFFKRIEDNKRILEDVIDLNKDWKNGEIFAENNNSDNLKIKNNFLLFSSNNINLANSLNYNTQIDSIFEGKIKQKNKENSQLNSENKINSGKKQPIKVDHKQKFENFYKNNLLFLNNKNSVLFACKDGKISRASEENLFENMKNNKNTNKSEKTKLIMNNLFKNKLDNNNNFDEEQKRKFSNIFMNNPFQNNEKIRFNNKK